MAPLRSSVIITAAVPGQPPIRVDLEQVWRRFLNEYIIELTAKYWEHRAETFDDAVPRPTDNHVTDHPEWPPVTRPAADPTSLADQANRCLCTAIACRHKATAIRMGSRQ